jgi:hypothetical protein
MTAIIAYGTVVRPPQVIGLPLPDEERSIGFSVVVEEDFQDDESSSSKRALYRVVLTGDQARYVEVNLKVGSSVLVRGEVFAGVQLMGGSAWNHRVVFGDEVVILTGELSRGRAYPLEVRSLDAKVAFNG